MKIHFKNKEVLTVTDEITEMLDDSMGSGCNDIQTFKNTSGVIILIVKISEIVFISK